MCTVSFIGDQWGKTIPQQYPWVQPYIQPYVTTQPEISRAEFDALKREMSELKKLLLAAKEYDAAMGEPDCEIDEKVVLLKRLAEFVGVDLTDVFEV